jgi:hypothetical protein
MEDKLLIKLMSESPKVNWNELAPSFPGKTAQQISERWSKVVNPDLVKGSWTRQEDELIIEFVRQYGTKNWTKLASFLPGRIGKQCRERWRNHLDPSNNYGAWTPEEDALLISLHAQFGNSWVKIAQRMPGRSDNSIKNRWNSTLRKNPNLAGAPIVHQRAENVNAEQVTPLPVITCQHSTPIYGAQKVVAITPQTPMTLEPLPKPVMIDEDTLEAFNQTSSGMTPRGFDIISPFIGKSPYALASPFYKQDNLMSPWGEIRAPSDPMFSPRFSPLISKPQNKEPNLTLLLEKV